MFACPSGKCGASLCYLGYNWQHFFLHSLQLCNIFSISFFLMQLIYVDHLDFPLLGPLEHVIDYSLPRACQMCKADFEFAVAIDKNKKTLTANTFGKRPVSYFVLSSHIFT